MKLTVLEILLNSGWKPGRRQGIARYRRAFRKRRLRSGLGEDAYLAEYGGLIIAPKGVTYGAIVFDPRVAIAEVDDTWLNLWEDHLALELIPIGVCGNEILLVGTDGGFYGAYGNRVGRLGSDVTKLVDSVFLNPSAWQLREINRSREGF